MDNKERVIKILKSKAFIFWVLLPAILALTGAICGILFSRALLLGTTVLYGIYAIAFIVYVEAEDRRLERKKITDSIRARRRTIDIREE